MEGAQPEACTQVAAVLTRNRRQSVLLRRRGRRDAWLWSVFAWCFVISSLAVFHTLLIFYVVYYFSADQEGFVGWLQSAAYSYATTWFVFDPAFIIAAALVGQRRTRMHIRRHCSDAIAPRRSVVENAESATLQQVAVSEPSSEAVARPVAQRAGGEAAKLSDHSAVDLGEWLVADRHSDVARRSEGDEMYAV